MILVHAPSYSATSRPNVEVQIAYSEVEKYNIEIVFVNDVKFKSII
jgi:hypothetical protein